MVNDTHNYTLPVKQRLVYTECADVTKGRFGNKIPHHQARKLVKAMLRTKRYRMLIAMPYSLHYN